ncbi:uncharacterized protein CPUR_08704 [Claviceps purpurea 20.1]|uniref:Uncharacterized protein n=1 Tax=Claviceps purpurea (strain 20.1) TaxID=1111077 RepID=M1WGQ8_CLAP2|nr:uncharacterized protein CPUR_08704 [Claviceps purpurea 20.1]
MSSKDLICGCPKSQAFVVAAARATLVDHDVSRNHQGRPGFKPGADSNNFIHDDDEDPQTLLMEIMPMLCRSVCRLHLSTSKRRT